MESRESRKQAGSSSVPVGSVLCHVTVQLGTEETEGASGGEEDDGVFQEHAYLSVKGILLSTEPK